MLQEVKNVVDEWTQFSEMDELTSVNDKKDAVDTSDEEVRLFAEMLASM